MNKQDLVKNIAARTGLPQRAVEDMLAVQAEQAHAALYAGEEFTVPGIGRLTATQRAARTGRNPKTGEQIHIPAKRTPTFTAAKALKDACNA